MSNKFTHHVHTFLIWIGTINIIIDHRINLIVDTLEISNAIIIKYQGGGHQISGKSVELD